MTKMKRIMVKGKPFLSLGGQSHNSSSYLPETMGPTWRSIEMIGANTLATPIPWDAFEPEEGRFNHELVKTLIDEARIRGMKLVFLWFASWKNGSKDPRLLYEPGRAMIFQESEKVFYFIGHNATVSIIERPPMDGSMDVTYGNYTLMHVNMDSVSTTQGVFDEDGNFVVKTVRSGDESRHGVWLRYDTGVVRVELV